VARRLDRSVDDLSLIFDVLDFGKPWSSAGPLSSVSEASPLLFVGGGRGNGDPQRRPTIRPRRPGDFFGSAPCDAAMKIIAAASASAAMLIV